jgi:hypothetical protein
MRVYKCLQSGVNDLEQGFVVEGHPDSSERLLNLKGLLK